MRPCLQYVSEQLFGVPSPQCRPRRHAESEGELVAAVHVLCSKERRGLFFFSVYRMLWSCWRRRPQGGQSFPEFLYERAKCRCQCVARKQPFSRTVPSDSEILTAGSCAAKSVAEGYQPVLRTWGLFLLLTRRPG